MATDDTWSLPDLGKSINPIKAQELVDRYTDRLLALARRRISQRLASRIDPEDIVQSVFRTFFRRAKEKRFTIADHDDLSKLLFRITVHKTLRQVAHHKAAKRDPNQETAQGEHSQEMVLELLGKEPTPATVAIFVDQMDHFFQRLDPEMCKILQMRMDGYGTEEIAKELNTYDRKVRRVLERIRGIAESAGLSPPGE
jgi:RNA polymerase sigma-70 factor (ECF subfamily)